MNIQITRTTPIYEPVTGGVFVQWTVTSPPTTPVPFTLLRSGSPAGPFEVVQAGIDANHFYDKHVPVAGDEQTPAQRSLQMSRYYAVEGGGVRSTAVPVGDSLPQRQALLRRKIQRDIAVGFRVGSGIPWLVLARRRWGINCPACYDKLTKSVTNTRCTTCYGTRYVGGYHDPYRISARKGTTNPQVSVAPQGNVEVNQIEITMLDYPSVQVDDVFVEERQNRRYVVQHVARTELRGVPVHQKLVVSELARDSIEYQIPVPMGASPTYY